MKGKQKCKDARGAENDDEEGEGEFRSEKLNGKTEQRGAASKGDLNPLGTYNVGVDQNVSRAKELREESEKRGKALKESRAVTVGSSNVILPQHQGCPS